MNNRIRLGDWTKSLDFAVYQHRDQLPNNTKGLYAHIESHCNHRDDNWYCELVISDNAESGVAIAIMDLMGFDVGTREME